MTDLYAQVIAEFRSLGAWCVIHGPEIWFAIAAVGVMSAVLVLGMWLGALLGANGRDDDDR